MKRQDPTTDQLGMVQFWPQQWNPLDVVLTYGLAGLRAVSSCRHHLPQFPVGQSTKPTHCSFAREGGNPLEKSTRCSCTTFYFCSTTTSRRCICPQFTSSTPVTAADAITCSPLTAGNSRGNGATIPNSQCHAILSIP